MVCLHLTLNGILESEDGLEVVGVGCRRREWFVGSSNLFVPLPSMTTLKKSLSLGLAASPRLLALLGPRHRHYSFDNRIIRARPRYVLSSKRV